ncbi:MAG: 3D domain-containing protein [Alcanivorax sp.]|nr:3D domain-containing protein [Alcanivorax sp.]
MNAGWVLFALLLAGPAPAEDFSQRRTVTATAFNSLPGQGHGEDHSLAAWGDTLVPGMKAIAVSRDLLAAGLDYGTAVKIEGLDGTWYVRDKMHARWRNKIDIYLGEDREAALEWGRRRVEIRY